MKKASIPLLLIVLISNACQIAPITTPGNIPGVEIVTSTNPLADTPTVQPSATFRRTPVAESLNSVIAFYSDQDGNPEIYSIQPDGSGLARLTNDPGFDDSPAISPDGTRIAFLTARHDPNPRFPNLKYELYLMEIDGSNPHRLTPLRLRRIILPGHRMEAGYSSMPTTMRMVLPKSTPSGLTVPT